MGVDITHIVRHDFDDVQNEEASMKYVLDTIQLLKKNLYIDDPLESFSITVNKYENEIAECKIKYEALKKRLSSLGYQPIELSPFWGYIRCIRMSDKTVHLLNSKTLEPLICGSPQAYYFDFIPSLFVVKQNDKYALYDIEGGKQITEYVTQPFRKEWNKELNEIIVVNEEIGKYYYLKQEEIKSGRISQLS